ncbi:hypothetical protein [Salipiger mucosus]|uniref:Uncharacterized protein n=1 Tax=Salipiger mucosus DSM 16094 TaxID=1123237 RepID=S9Q7B9_9RHOB|nr:hypothetical protein [Salipiger mucosus]EPX75513.1 hypothetical protein Salmuc_04703 [Salipiger mucosus DSM 16094]
MGMSDLSQRRRGIVTLRAAATLLSLGGTGFMISVLLGWALDVDPLVRGAPGQHATVPTTALALAFLYLSLLLSLHRRRGPALLLAVLSAGVGAATLFSDPAGGAGALAGQTGDRMAPGTLAGILLAVLCVVLQLSKAPLARQWAVGLGVLGASSTAAVLAGHSFDPHSTFSLALFRETSLQTAIGLLGLYALVLLVALARAERR